MPLSIRGPVNYSRVEPRQQEPAANDALPGFCVRCGGDKCRAHLDGVGFIHRRCMNQAEVKAHRKAYAQANPRRR